MKIKIREDGLTAGTCLQAAFFFVFQGRKQKKHKKKREKEREKKREATHILRLLGEEISEITSRQWMKEEEDGGGMSCLVGLYQQENKETRGGH